MKRTFRDILLEAAGYQKVYVEPTTGQYVEMTNHAAKDRIPRQWWTSLEDDSFTNFVGKGLRRLNSLYKEKIKDPKYPIHFQFEEVIGILNKNRSRGMVVSLRDTGGNKYTSFGIMTVLDKDATDARSDQVYIKVASDKHLIVLNESTGEEISCYFIEI